MFPSFSFYFFIMIYTDSTALLITDVRRFAARKFRNESRVEFVNDIHGSIGLLSTLWIVKRCITRSGENREWKGTIILRRRTLLICETTTVDTDASTSCEGSTSLLICQIVHPAFVVTVTVDMVSTLQCGLYAG